MVLPFMLNTRQHPWLSVELLKESCLETSNDFASIMEKATDKACSALTQAADDMAQFYDTHHREAPLYEIRDKVWLNGQNIMTRLLTKKLDHKWLGPYPVEKSSCGMHTTSSYPHPLAKPTQSSQ